MPTVTALMQRIETAVPPLEGWCDVPKAHHLAALVIALRPKISVEIGVFGGRSLIPLALAHRFVGEGFALGIDPWATAPSVDGMDGVNAEWWGKLDHEAIYQGFLKASADVHGDGFLKVFRGTSDAAIAEKNLLPPVIDLLHIDGNHGPQAGADVNHYATRLRPGGILVMDDIDWAAAATARVKELRFTHLYPLGTGAVFQR